MIVSYIMTWQGVLMLCVLSSPLDNPVAAITPNIQESNSYRTLSFQSDVELENTMYMHLCIYTNISTCTINFTCTRWNIKPFVKNLSIANLKTCLFSFEFGLILLLKSHQIWIKLTFKF